MKKILVPVDFSEHSENAIKVAAVLAKKHNAKLLLLHMLGLNEAFLTHTVGQDIAEAIYFMKLAKNHFEELLQKPFLKDVVVAEIVQNYKHFNEVNNVALENNVDLIVMGSHGTNPFSGFFVGSNTEKVVRTSDVPVLVIKENNPNFGLKKIVFACDFKTENIHVYRKAMQLFELLGAVVDLVYINLSGEMFKTSTKIDQLAGKFLDKAAFNTSIGPQNFIVLNGFSVEQALYDYAEKIEADALALPTHGRRGLAHFFSGGSIGEDIANHANVPVFTFKI